MFLSESRKESSIFLVGIAADRSSLTPENLTAILLVFRDIRRSGSSNDNDVVDIRRVIAF